MADKEFYVRRDDGSIDLLELFDSRMGDDQDLRLYDKEHIMQAKKMLRALEHRQPVASRQVAELAVMFAEQHVVQLTVYRQVGNRLKRPA